MMSNSKMALNKVELVSPLSLQTCISRLQALDTDRQAVIRMNTVAVSVTPSTETIFDFRIRVFKYLNLVVTMAGSLTYQSPSTTLVEGEAQISLKWDLLHGLFLIVLALSFVSWLTKLDQRQNLTFLIWCVFAATLIGLSRILLIRWRNQIVQLVQQTLKA